MTPLPSIAAPDLAVTFRPAGFLLIAAVVAGYHNGPTRPSPPAAADVPAPAPRTVEITGQLWLHDAAGRHPGVGHVSGFVFAPTWGGAMPPAAVSSDGSYRARVPADSLVYLTATAGHQPCMAAVRTGATGAVEGAEVHVVTDRALLGAALPPQLPQRANRVTGVVYEPQPDGSRVPLAGAWVGLDGAFGDGLVIADTLSGADGRYVLCGIDPVAGAAPAVGVTLFAGLEAYQPFFLALAGTTDAVVDIPLRRRAGG